MRFFRKGAPTPSTRQVTLLTRPGCHLCHKARAVVANITEELGASWQELNVDDDAELCARYTDQVPVTLIDGALHDTFRVDPDRFRRALRSR